MTHTRATIDADLTGAAFDEARRILGGKEGDSKVFTLVAGESNREVAEAIQARICEGWYGGAPAWVPPRRLVLPDEMLDSRFAWAVVDERGDSVYSLPPA
jgi:hypothetical protein